ncbi:hypothetical protein FM076_33080 [Streptomyces albus subsp. chlorinus]|uniref:hypothetical protein n=1 Tax=Streptomyces albus TaxID=1888 RepID=UPI00156F619B|nr:hypothetical protein [Streptomyces albus]NSC25720.1 hypothetical protein [Streptomyces albus subsp. chlorinus]
MTSRHNERLQERRQALREQHKRELEEAKRRQAAQLSAITTYDQRIAKLEDARRDVAASVAEAVAAFGGRRDAAAALGLTSAEVRDYLSLHQQNAGASSGSEAAEQAGKGDSESPDADTAANGNAPTPWPTPQTHASQEAASPHPLTAVPAQAPEPS